jgi:hypothetical protein
MRHSSVSVVVQIVESTKQSHFSSEFNFLKLDLLYLALLMDLLPLSRLFQLALVRCFPIAPKSLKNLIQVEEFLPMLR